MRFRLFASFLVVCAATGLGFAATPACAAAPEPPALEPLPEAPPPPDADYANVEPQITITQRNGETHEEARVNGILKWIKVTPRYGRSYYLIPNPDGYTFIRRDSLVTGLKVPMWLLLSW